MSVKRKKTFPLALFVLTLLSLIVAYIYVQRIYEPIILLFTNPLHERELSFMRSPKIRDCITLMDEYIARGKNEEGLQYASRCLALGADKTALGWHVHLEMALIHYRTGNESEACHQLGIALRLDKENIITRYNHLAQLGLTCLPDICAGKFQQEFKASKDNKRN